MWPKLVARLLRRYLATEELSADQRIILIWDWSMVRSSRFLGVGAENEVCAFVGCRRMMMPKGFSTDTKDPYPRKTCCRSWAFGRTPKNNG
jgi:hypothetical protein